MPKQTLQLISWNVNGYRAAMKKDFLSSIKHLDADIVGLQDPFRPEADRDFYVREFAPRVELITVDGASHALPDEQPQQVARHMIGWIRARTGHEV